MSAKCIDKNRLKLTWLHDNYKTQTCLVAMWFIAGKSILGFTICQNSKYDSWLRDGALDQEMLFSEYHGNVSTCTMKIYVGPLH